MKESTDAVVITDSPAVNVTLENFCVSLSARDNRPHMVGAFYTSQVVAKSLFDTPESYQSRYDAFVNQPA
jgi:hypothetical protein